MTNWTAPKPPRTGQVTASIAVVTAICWLGILLFDRSGYAAGVAGFVPLLVSLGTMDGGMPFWLRPLSATFVHFEFFHLAFNLLILVWSGRQVESAVGGWMLALLYGVGAYAGALGIWALDPSSGVVHVGASGAVSTVLAVYALVFSEQEVKPIAGLPPHVVRALWLGIAWVGIQALIGVALGGPVAVVENGAGFLAGLLLARPVLRWRYRER